MAVNAHRVFSSSNNESYLNALTLDDKKIEALRAARDEVRECVRKGFTDWSAFVGKSDIFEATATDVPTSLKPKFKMQGSFAYKTLNEPAVTPPQQIDLDDGVFLPVSFINANGSLQPSVASQGYFKLIEVLLQPLCDRNGWKLITDKTKCVRVGFDEHSHMDLALYSIPEKEFVLLVEKANSAKVILASDERELLSEVYTAISKDQIMLAHRKDGWISSDPRKLEGWFHDALNVHGEQFRRVCRYLKGWRDFQWEENGPSSIALMACVKKIYDEGIGSDAKVRDDLALSKISHHLPELFQQRIENPVVQGVFLEEWSPQERASFTDKANQLASSISNAIDGSNPAKAIEHLQRVFGDRISEKTEFIELLPDFEAPSINILRAGILRGLEDEPDVKSATKLGSDQRYG